MLHATTKVIPQLLNQSEMFGSESNPSVDLKCSQAGTFEDKIISLKHISESLENYCHVMITQSVISEGFCTGETCCAAKTAQTTSLW